ncbi:MAG TPA: GNAT family N-acetyltransferase [Gemmatimonadaceae bacterium]|nr:GNAT family N-acetyltransferase [Gemmatimonadaceae bacterium]
MPPSHPESAPAAADTQARAAARPAPRDSDLPGLQVRHIHTADEFNACVTLQEETWGAQFNERVPAAILKVSQRVGGITAGAFDRDDRLIGFVFGLTGVERGDLVHWSDMLAVRPEFRDHGIGRHLKEFQREAVSRLGVVRMYWTFDPLVARNAHLNLNRLGVRIAEYIPDMYGRETSSTLHRGIGSDRFVANWAIREAGPARRPDLMAGFAGVRDVPVLNSPDHAGIPTAPDGAIAHVNGLCRVAIPLDIEAVQQSALAAAAQWRATTRQALQWGLQHSYAIRGFYRDDAAGYGYYVLSTTPLPEGEP